MFGRKSKSSDNTGNGGGDGYGKSLIERPKTEVEIAAEEEAEAEKMSQTAAPLFDHLTELRSRLIISVGVIIVAFIGCFLVSEHLLNYLVMPFSTVAPDESIYFKPLGKFFAQVRVALYGAVFVSFPVLAYQLYRFIAPGLYKREQTALLPFVFAMPVLFAAGAALVYYVMIPFVMRFAVGFEANAGENAPVNYELLTDVGDYLTLVTTLMMAFGLAFQLPVLLTLIASAGLLTSATLRKFRKAAIVGIFAVAAVLTPPDPFSQVILALTVIGLYEVLVFSVGLVEKKAREASKQDLKDEDSISA